MSPTDLVIPSAVARLVNTSADDLKSALGCPPGPNLETLEQALAVVESRGEKTKARLIAARIRQLSSTAIPIEIVDESSPSTAIVAASPFTDDDRLRGQQLTAAFHDANDGLKRVLIFGSMMMEQKRVVDSTRGANSPKRGPGTKGTGFKAWLAECAPDVAKSEASAYRYMALAEGVHEALKLGKNVDLSQLLASSDEELSPALKKKQTELLDLISGKSARQLLLELGGGSKPRGGKREAAGPEETPEEKEARVLAARRENFAVRIAGIAHATEDQDWRVVEDIEIEHAIDTLEAFIAGAREWLKTPKSKRAAIAIGRGE